MEGTAAAARSPDSVEPWTFEDVLALPKSLWRYEIVDGGLLVTPPAGVWREYVSARLREALSEAVGPRQVALGPVGVGIHPTYLIPDLVVIDAKASRTAGASKPGHTPP